jgi:sarcosine oxidase subunit beta
MVTEMNNIRKSPDVLIIGGGIMGCSLAYRLAERGVGVTLLEKNTCGAEASGRNSGGVRAHMRDPQELKLAIASKEMWLHLSEELDFDIEYRRIGLLMIAYTEERMKECRA